MQARPMTAEELMLLIGGVALLVVLFTGSMFVFFRRFLNKEREKAKAFREGKANERDRT
ncbi:MAG TPA: hypothetical protein VK934_06615 [Fimbriimonas sp.]|nr:hypothetical protein [Fimbriimonas sp.]